MGGLLLILPIVAFDVWLCATTGKKQIALWRAEKNWRHMTLALLAGLLIAFFLAFLVRYKSGDKLRVEGFPIPVAFFHFDDKTWTRTTPPDFLRACGQVADFLTGLAAPWIPFKIAEFLRAVKAELK